MEEYCCQVHTWRSTAARFTHGGVLPQGSHMEEYCRQVHTCRSNAASFTHEGVIHKVHTGRSNAMKFTLGGVMPQVSHMEPLITLNPQVDVPPTYPNKLLSPTYHGTSCAQQRAPLSRTKRMEVLGGCCPHHHHLARNPHAYIIMPLPHPAYHAAPSLS